MQASSLNSQTLMYRSKNSWVKVVMVPYIVQESLVLGGLLH